MKKIVFITALFATSIVFTSCEKENPKPEKPKPQANPKEIITTAKLTLEDSLGNIVIGIWKDIDGDGPGAPIISGLTLKAGMHYDGIVLLMDETKSPVDTVSNEVKKEAEAHQFFYTPQDGVSSRLEIEREDKDKNNQPVGLMIHIDVSAGTTAAGSLKVVLKHYDGINKSLDPTIGETDVEAVFPVTIQ